MSESTAASVPAAAQDAQDALDVLIVGAGPAGYVCALRAAQLGLSVACVDAAPTLGGTCLNVGCIPSKALLESSERFAHATTRLADHGVVLDGALRVDLGRMLARKDDLVARLTGGIGMLFGKHGIARVEGRARLLGPGRVAVGDRELRAKAVVIATGSVPAALPGLPFDGVRVVTSTEALGFDRVPKHLVVVGAGAIGLELGSVWRRLGAEVTVLEHLDRILPGVDLELAKQAKRVFTAQGMRFVLGARVQGAESMGEWVKVSWTDAHGEGNFRDADRVLVAVGRRPCTEGLGCQEAGVELDERGRVVVDAGYQTTVPGVYAIGDVIRGPMLAHKASDEGIALAEALAGQPGHVNYDAIPSIVYTDPEIASVGLSEEDLKASGVPYAKGRFRYGSNGRALALGEADGVVKILAHAETDRLLGCHILGARAGDLIAEAVLAIEFGASAEDLARSVHAHPTLSEVVREAALDVARRALHK